MKTMKKKVEAMRRTANKLIVMTLALLLVVPAFVQPAAANQPIMEKFEASGSIEDPAGGGCGFPLIFEFQNKVSRKIFLDRSSTPYRVVAHVRAEITITNPENGKFVTSFNAFQRMFDLPNPERFTEVGLRVLIRSASGAAVVVDTGKLIFDVNGNILFEAGPHPFGVADEPPQEVCAELL